VSSVCVRVCPVDAFREISGSLICTWACGQCRCPIRVLYDMPVLLAVFKKKSWRRRGVEQNLPRLYRNTGSLLYACRSIIQNKRCVQKGKRIIQTKQFAGGRVSCQRRAFNYRLCIHQQTEMRASPAALPPDSDEILMCHWLIKKGL
jgi:hypothetical protein